MQNSGISERGAAELLGAAAAALPRLPAAPRPRQGAAAEEPPRQLSAPRSPAGRCAGAGGGRPRGPPPGLGDSFPAQPRPFLPGPSGRTFHFCLAGGLHLAHRARGTDGSLPGGLRRGALGRGWGHRGGPAGPGAADPGTQRLPQRHLVGAARHAGTRGNAGGSGGTRGDPGRHGGVRGDTGGSGGKRGDTRGSGGTREGYMAAAQHPGHWGPAARGPWHHGGAARRQFLLFLLFPSPLRPLPRRSGPCRFSLRPG